VHAPEQDAAQVDRVLLASEGRPFTPAALDLAAQVGAHVHVFAVVRVWGSGFGFPNPGLLPTKPEWDATRAVVTDAVAELKRRGVDASGHVLATRKATKRIVGAAGKLGCGAIVMPADERRNRFVADLMWSQEPYRVKRKARVPVYLVTQ
jgi:hypothetical protein